MKTLISSVFLLHIFLFGQTGFLNGQSSLVFTANKFGVRKTYRISKKSVLKLNGKTNVNGFTCDCNETFQPQQFVVENEADGGLSLNFQMATLSLKIKSLDCGNALMNKDLQKALHASEHPSITIELKKVEQDKCNRLTELKDWVKLKALTKITLNGVSQEYWLSITAKKFSPNQFRFICTKTLNMSDFGVTPPVAMMGMIKVQDAITINLDLDVTIE
ncbi:MAG: hypothetical protein GC192_12975 [Bacteroidetes bacterium]|nr:hypothetical protein [Bacteroidota bacterium]